MRRLVCATSVLLAMIVGALVLAGHGDRARAATPARATDPVMPRHHRIAVAMRRLSAPTVVVPQTAIQGRSCFVATASCSLHACVEFVSAVGAPAFCGRSSPNATIISRPSQPARSTGGIMALGNSLQAVMPSLQHRLRRRPPR